MEGMNDRTHAHSRAEFLRRVAGAALGAYGARLAGFTGLAKAVPAVRPVLTTQDVPLDEALARGRRVLAAPDVPRFDLIGLHWQGAGAVLFRTRSLAGAWTPWQRASVHEGPDPGVERTLRGWSLGTPVWTGGSDAVQFRVEGALSRLRAHYVSSPRAALPARAGRALHEAEQPPIILRADWGADERIVRAPPLYADRLLLSIVHHTAGKSPATPQDSAAIVRAIQVYHVESNGWNDIGYNFLVDPFGQVFEGRAGGIDRNVVGAHALGFNTGSTGVALLGNFQAVEEADGAKQALESLLAWRLDVGHVDPLATVAFPSGGRLYPLRAVSGHRDVNSTECPGSYLYADLDEVAGAAAALGLPKLFDPLASATADGSVRFTARLSEALPWTVTVSDQTGSALATGSGSGTAVDWTWTPQPALGRAAVFTISAPGVRAATGPVSLGDGAPPPTEIPPRPARPAGVPKRIPRWAWLLRRWLLTPKDKRGGRPRTPKKLPAWFWPWFRWLNALEQWHEQYGRRA
jgi:hypothetical protein